MKRKMQRYMIPLCCVTLGFAVNSVVFAGSTDLSEYLGRDIEETAEELELMEPAWSMGITGTGNESLYVGSSEGAEGLTDTIAVRGGGDQYSIYGLTSRMSLEEAREVVLEKNFFPVEGAEDCYFDGTDRFLSLISRESGLEATLSKQYVKPREGAAELWSYVGKTVEEMQEDFPELESAAADGQVELSADGLSVLADLNDENTGDSVISKITVSGFGGKYCLYGLLPGDEVDCGRELGFSEGGSGEFMDMVGRILYLGESLGENPQISLYSR